MYIHFLLVDFLDRMVVIRMRLMTMVIIMVIMVCSRLIGMALRFPRPTVSECEGLFLFELLGM